MLKKTIVEFITFNLVGIVNTLIGFSIIFALMFAGFSAVESNVVGYAIGAIVSYNLNKKYTFKDTQNSKMQIVKFFSVLFVAYILNFITLQTLLNVLDPYISQLISAIVYTLSSFLLAKAIVFQKQGENV